MDQALKARKLGSATARRKRMQQREIAMQEAEERRTRILLYGYSSEEDETSEEEGNTYSPIPDTQSDRARPAWSLSSVSSDTATNNPNSPRQQSEPASLLLPSILPEKPYMPLLVIPQALSPDFDSYFPTNLPDDDADEESSTELETPIEVATPVEYCNPRARPLMISIKTSSSTKSNSESHHRPASMPQPPPVPSRSGRRVSSISLRSAISEAEAEASVTALPSLPGHVPEGVRTDEKNIRRRPVPVLVNSEPTLQYRNVTHDGSLQRSSRISARKADRPTSREAQQPTTLASTPPKASERRISSFPTVPLSPPRGPSAKKPVSTLRQRGSSIGLALRTASSTFRNKPTNTRPPTSSSSESSNSKMELDVGTFPMPPPSPLLQPLSSQPSKTEENRSDTRNSSVTSSGSSRLRRVRTTIGL